MANAEQKYDWAISGARNVCCGQLGPLGSGLDNPLYVGSGCCGVYHQLVPVTAAGRLDMVDPLNLELLELTNLRDSAVRRANILTSCGFAVTALLAIAVIVLSSIGATNNDLSTAIHVAVALITGIGGVLAITFKGFASSLESEAAGHSDQLQTQAKVRPRLLLDAVIPSYAYPNPAGGGGGGAAAPHVAPIA